MKTITEYLQSGHLNNTSGEITDFRNLVVGEYYTLKKDENVYDIFKFKEAINKDGEYRLYYSELVVIDTDWRGKPVYFSDKNTNGNYLQAARIEQRKLYIASEEDIVKLEQARTK